MPRVGLLFSLAALLLVAGRSSAQPQPQPKDGKVVIPLSLTPAVPPKPVSKFYLTPEYRDLIPGEQLSGFLKCFMEQDAFFNKENTEKRYKWLQLPLAELPKDVREQAGIKDGIAYNPPYARLMVYMDQAARYTRLDWNEWFNLRHDGVYMLLPEAQKLRSLAPVLQLRMRGEVKNGEFDRAAVSAKTLFGLAQMMEQHPTLIGYLIGVAIATHAVGPLEEMIAQPGCPNLYWSFADLPTPPLSLRRGMEGERVFLTSQFQPMLKADHPLPESELTKYVKQVEKIVAMSNEGPANRFLGRPNRPSVRYALLAANKEHVAAARKRLIEIGGMRPEAVKKFPPLQVVLTDDLLQVDVYRDELFKWLNLPYYQMMDGITAMEAKIKEVGKTTVLVPLLLPTGIKVKQAETRFTQRIAYLRVIEAIRLYAHDHDNKLPPSLDAIKLPLPVDPVTGKAFSYQVKDDVATLTGGNPNPDNAVTNRVYELRIRK
jgi:hypothetical protein